MGKQQRLVIVVSVLASFVAFLDGSIINVALPSISRDIGSGLAAQQWIVDAYNLPDWLRICTFFSDMMVV
ncbi:hypothetical protein H0X10_01930 [Candidatus Saccharibacteria bacterium]|nr:hypothetical protein [Candidatus Saccharibacteria bacterium]